MPSRVPHGALNPPSSVYLAAHAVHRLGQLDITLLAADMHVGSCSHHNKPLDNVLCSWWPASGTPGAGREEGPSASQLSFLLVCMKERGARVPTIKIPYCQLRPSVSIGPQLVTLKYLQKIIC